MAAGIDKAGGGQGQTVAFGKDEHLAPNPFHCLECKGVACTEIEEFGRTGNLRYAIALQLITRLQGGRARALAPPEKSSTAISTPAIQFVIRTLLLSF